MPAIRVQLPHHLYSLARCTRELALDIRGPVTLSAVLDAIEAAHPDLDGLIRDRATRQRRPLIRFYACHADLSNTALDAPLPDDVASGREPLLVVGAIAGG